MNHPGRYASPDASKAPAAAASKAGKSLHMQAYELVKHRILTLQFPPGACLNEANLSQLLNIGRTPIHQALNRLTLEGMIQVIPRKGIIVKPVSMDEVMENIEIRLVNEMCCARLAALRRDERDIAEMKRILADARTELPTQNIERQMILDHDFHLAISTAAKNRMLTDILSNLHDQSLRFWFISLREHEHHAAVQDEHQAVLDAIIAQDPDAASEMTRNHIESFRKNVVRLL
ncbi:GntR family transcriptional regulator [Noviherbaspirillum sp.]|uniref:GntR family transcriptional regulator n=1 Tax=Noviherbaspirillum sp. TaxID=1926288 RepID=UPI002B47B855|nr:GntR family transcriptional regulator [Noviherbaspirillum sp.]HJV81996.1 GntR family transcriptional regulator [Noviherbaspirillum sp.]